MSQIKTYPDIFDDFLPGPYAPARHRHGMPQYSREATTDIYPSRLVSLDTAVLGGVRQALAGDRVLYGVSQAEIRGSPYNPSLAKIEKRAAAAGDNVFIFGPESLDVPLMYGGIVHIKDRLTSDSQGRAVKANAGDVYTAIAQEPGNVGQIHKVTVCQPQRMR